MAPKAPWLQPQWKELIPAVVTERGVWSENGMIAGVHVPGMRDDERSIMQDMIPVEHLDTVRILMVETMSLALRAGYALIDERTIN